MKILPGDLRGGLAGARKTPGIDFAIFGTDHQLQCAIAIQIGDGRRSRNRIAGIFRPAGQQPALHVPNIDFAIAGADSDFQFAVAVEISDDRRPGNFGVRHGRPAGQQAAASLPGIDLPIFTTNDHV